jgi:tetratricopeptide (TPR) repeat protein
VVLLLASVASVIPALHAPVCQVLGPIALDALSPGCAATRHAREALAAGHTALKHNALREALDHYRMAGHAAPALPDAHLAEAETAEMLGEYRQAFVAYTRALDASPTLETRVRLGAAAEAVGDTDTAVRTLTSAYGTWRDHAKTATYGAGLAFGACAPSQWSDPLGLWSICANGARRAWHRWMDASRERVPNYVFHVLVEAGRRDEALALARERGWVRPDVDYCGNHGVPVSSETSALLAILTQPQRADCAVPTALGIADNGGARLGRMMLQDRAERSPDPETRRLAQHFLRYRLPDHDVPKLAQSLNATAWRLQHVHGRSDEALAVFQRAIDADPRFTWPHHNIGRLYMAQQDYDQALVWLTRALEVNPDHWRALYNFGITNHRLRRYPEALAAYRKALAISPDDADLHANVAWVLIRLGEQVEGERELQVALRLNPEHSAARDYLNARYGRDARVGATPASTP